MGDGLFIASGRTCAQDEQKWSGNSPSDSKNNNAEYARIVQGVLAQNGIPSAVRSNYPTAQALADDLKPTGVPAIASLIVADRGTVVYEPAVLIKAQVLAQLGPSDWKEDVDGYQPKIPPFEKWYYLHTWQHPMEPHHNGKMILIHVQKVPPWTSDQMEVHGLPQTHE